MLVDINMLTNRVQKKLLCILNMNVEKTGDISSSTLKFLIQQNVFYEFIRLLKNYGMAPKINEDQAKNHCPPFYYLYMYYIENNRDYEKRAKHYIKLMTSSKSNKSSGKRKREEDNDDDEDKTIDQNEATNLKMSTYNIFSNKPVSEIKNVWHLIFMVFTYQYGQNVTSTVYFTHHLLKGGVLVRKDKCSTYYPRNIFAFQKSYGTDSRNEATKISQFGMASIDNMVTTLTEFATLMLENSPLRKRAIVPSANVKNILDANKEQRLVIDIKEKEVIEVGDDNLSTPTAKSYNSEDDTPDTHLTETLNRRQKQNLMMRTGGAGGATNGKKKKTATNQKNNNAITSSHTAEPTSQDKTATNKKRQSKEDLNRNEKKKSRKVSPDHNKLKMKLLNDFSSLIKKEIYSDVPLASLTNKSHDELLAMGFPKQHVNPKQGINRKYHEDYKVVKITDKKCKAILGAYNIKRAQWETKSIQDVDKDSLDVVRVLNLLVRSGYELINQQIEKDPVKDLYLIHKKIKTSKKKEKGVENLMERFTEGFIEYDEEPDKSDDDYTEEDDKEKMSSGSESDGENSEDNHSDDESSDEEQSDDDGYLLPREKKKEKDPYPSDSESE